MVHDSLSIVESGAVQHEVKPNAKACVRSAIVDASSRVLCRSTRLLQFLSDLDAWHQRVACHMRRKD